MPDLILNSGPLALAKGAKNIVSKIVKGEFIAVGFSQRLIEIVKKVALAKIERLKVIYLKHKPQLIKIAKHRSTIINNNYAIDCYKLLNCAG